MTLHTLDSMFHPQRIAVIGVTPNPLSVGGKILTNLVGGGFRGVVYPVSPSSEAVLGIPCYPSVGALPKAPDLGIICAGAELVPDLLRQCGEAGIRGIIINSAGFREAGPEGRALEDRVRAEQARWPGMTVIGPNCLGVIVPGIGLNASFANGMPRPGSIAFVSQSGALCSSVLDWALEEKIGFSYFVSIGNMLDVTVGDLIDYFGEDEKTKSIILYVESITDARRFMSAARSFARTKPIVAYKAGRFPQSAEAAASHTGAMASEDAVYDAAFQRAGLARVYDIGDIFNVAELIGRQKIPRGPRLGIITNAGGPGVMATDTLLALDGTLAELAPETIAKLGEALPPMWSRRNPVDVLGDARSKRVAKALDIVLADPGVDAVLVIITPQAMTNPTSIAKAVGELASTAHKPVLGAWLGGQAMREGNRVLAEAGLPAYTTPEEAVRAFMTLVAYARNREILYETPKDISVEFPMDRSAIRRRAEILHDGESTLVTEQDSKMLLEAYGIPTARPHAAATDNEAVAVAERLGYPVVLKIHSPDITHKTDVGGVVLDLRDADMVRGAFHSIMTGAAATQPDARLEGVTVQPMIDTRHAVELILGFKKDAVFGTVIMVGQGGITAELMRDRALGFPPLNERLARRMLSSLRIWPLFNGYRGRPPLAVDRLIEVLIRLSYLAADFPEITELDVNPLLVTPGGVIALDARIVADPSAKPDPAHPYAHLVLPPYPEEYVSSAEVDGERLTLRPIKPEDEPLWLDLLRSCSRESIYTRFRSFFHWESHEVATRYCFIDYERELAIVAEQEHEGERRLLGVGRLITEADRRSAEYAVLVCDAWQNRGLGGVLTDVCLDIARRWGLERVTAQTTSDNRRMVSVFQKRGFTVTPDPGSSLVEVAMDLSV